MMIEYFMQLIERQMLDASVGASIMNLIPEEVWDQIHIYADNTMYQENTHDVRHVANIETSSELQVVTELLTRLVGTQKKKD